MLIGHSWADLNGTILQIDDPVADLLQRRRRDIEGRSYLAITHPADRPRSAANVSTLKLGAGPRLIRKRYLAEDGGEIWVALQTARVGTDPASSHLVGSFMVNLPENEPRRLWRQARQLVDLYRVRGELLGKALFSDHAWIVLLHVYLAEAEGRAIGAADVAQHEGIALRTVVQWSKALHAHGLLLFRPERPAAYELTADGLERIEGTLARLWPG